VDSQFDRRKEAIVRSTFKLLEGAALGAAAAYMFDPDRGRARRARLRDQLDAKARRAGRRAGQRWRDADNRVKGLAARAGGGGRFHPVDDTAVVEHLRTVLARLDVSTADITTEVVDGVARVRGEIANQAAMDKVMSAVAGEAGVSRVENLMHLPGQLPPNKAATLRVSGQSP
jgi:hypothetical protein